MSRYFAIGFLFLIFHGAMAQEFLLEGKVYDQQSGTPIPYVNLSLLNTLKGTSTDESGHFYLDLPEAYKNRRVHISALGYRDSIVEVNTLYAQKKIGLKEESFELDEVVISEVLGNAEVLNPITGYSVASGFSSAATPWIIAVHFPNYDEGIKFLDKVTVFLQENSNFKRASSKFRLRFFSTDPLTGMPGKDLIRKSLIMEAPADGEFVMADLSEYQVQVPKEGIYVGLEWLFIPYNWYRSIQKNPISQQTEVEDRFSPTFAGVYSKDTSLKAMVYGSGHWSEFNVRSRDHSKILLPAISLKLIKE